MIGPVGYYKARKLAHDITLVHDLLQAMYEEGEISSAIFTRVLGRYMNKAKDRAAPLTKGEPWPTKGS